MKKLISIVSAAAICLFVSCNSKESGGGMSDKAKKNVENAKAITAMFEKGDFSKAGDYIAPDAVDHAGPRGDVKGLDSLKAEFNYFSSTMSDAKNEEVKTIADDDYVFQ